MEPAGRHIVVTGGASGIGRALALRFAEEGARAVVVADLDRDGVTDVAAELGGIAIAADVGSQRQVEQLIDVAEQANGPIDIFFSNAGVPGPPGGPEIPDDDWDLLWRVNVMAHVWAARALLPKMLERGEGYLLSTASAAGLLTQLGAIGYATTKHAAVAVAEWLAVTYGDRGIRVSCLCPQFVRTPMVTDQLDADKVAHIAELLEPEQVADSVIEAMREERFLILPHEEVERYMRNRGSDHPRWLKGMQQLHAQLGGLGRAQQ